MRKLYAVLESDYINCEMRYSFEIENDATPDEIREYADECIKNNICWHVEDEDGNEVEIY